MGYLDDHLLDGERIVYRARLHWIVFLPSLLLLLGATALGVLYAFMRQTDRIYYAVARHPDRFYIGWAALGLVALALLAAIKPWLRRYGSEFVVTNFRVLVKLGLFQRDSLETLLSKIEAVRVDQTIGGRLLGFGTITVIGTGGTEEAFARIAAPLEFRRQVQAQTLAMDSRRVAGAGAPAADASLPAAPRVERECPFCAERILARARVCRFCGRDVEPVAEGRAD